MQALVQISINLPPLNPLLRYNVSSIKSSIYNFKFSQSISYYTLRTKKIASFRKDILRAAALRERMSFSGLSRCKDGILVNKGKRVIIVRADKGFNELGGGGRISGENTRVLVNLGLAIVLTYLTMNGQLGWLLDAIVSIGVIVVLVPILGIGAFLWWAGRDIVQSSCPNCGNEFQIFKSTLNEELQLCPFCTQPFSVVGDKFVSDPVTFSNQTNQEFPPRKKKGKNPSISVVDIEAEVRDVD